MKRRGRKSQHRGRRRRYSILEAMERDVWHDYRGNCRRRGINFAVDFEDFRKLIHQKCHYCGASPSNIKRAGKNDGNRWLGRTMKYQGLDRKNNQRGYYLENIVPCCPECNSIKGSTLTYEEMLQVARALKNYRDSGKTNPQLLVQQELAQVLRVRLATTLREKAKTRR